MSVMGQSPISNRKTTGALGKNANNNQWQWSLDVQFRVNSISSRFAEIVGQQTAKKMIGKTFWEFADGTEIPKNHWQILNDTLTQHHNIEDFVFSIKTPEMTHHFIINGQPIITQGKFTGYKGVGSLASEDMLAKADLSQNRLSIVFKEIDLGLAILAQDKKIIEYNGSFYDTFLQMGFKVGPYTPMSELASFLSSHTKPVSFNGEIKKLVNSIQFLDHEPFEYVFKIGTEQYYKLSRKKRIQIFYALHLEDVSRMYHIQETMRAEIDTHKQRIVAMEKRLRSFEENSLKSMREINRLSTEKDISYQNFAEIIEMAGIALIRSDLNGDIEYINYKGAKALGFMSIADFKTKHTNLYKGFYPSFYDRITNEKTIKQNFGNLQDEISLDTSSNKKKHFNQTIIPIIDTATEQVSGFYTLLVDMTDQHSQKRKIKTQETQLKKLSEFRFKVISQTSENAIAPLKLIESQSMQMAEQIGENSPLYKSVQDISTTTRTGIQQLDMLSVVAELQAKRYILKEDIHNIAEHVVQICKTYNLPVWIENNNPEQLERFYLIYDMSLFEKAFRAIIDRFSSFHKHKNSTVEFMINTADEVCIRVIAPFSEEDSAVLEAIEAAEASGEEIQMLEPILATFGLYDPALLIADVVMNGHGGKISFKGHKGFNTTLLLYFPADRLRQKPDILNDIDDIFEVDISENTNT